MSESLPPDKNQDMVQQPKTMASLLKPNLQESRQELDTTVDQMLGKVKSVFYYISSRFNRKSILETFRKNFKSLAFEIYQFYEVEGVKFIVLEIGLFTNSADYAKDLSNSSAVNYKNVVLHSISDDDLDTAGRFIPKPERKVLVSGLGPHDLTVDGLRQGFDGVLEFSDCPRVTLLGDRANGWFSGEAVIQVKNFVTLPKKDFDFKIVGGYQRIKVQSFGFSNKLLEEERKDCYRCGLVGHLAKNCPARPKVFSWKCTTCGTESTKFGCTVRKCMKSSVEKSETRVTDNMYEVFNREGIRKAFGNDIDDWLHVVPSRKLDNPSPVQMMLALKYSSTVRNALTKGEHEKAHELLCHWLAVKLDEYDKNVDNIDDDLESPDGVA